MQFLCDIAVLWLFIVLHVFSDHQNSEYSLIQK